MWTIIRIKKNYDIKNLKLNLKKLLLVEPKLYSPKILQQNIDGNKFRTKNHYILGNYILVFHEKLREKYFLNKLKFTKGVDIVLNGFEYCQEEIGIFFKKCKANENKHGYLIQEFFINTLNNKIKFCSGPFINFAVNLIQVQKKKITVLAGKFEITVNKKNNYLISC